MQETGLILRPLYLSGKLVAIPSPVCRATGMPARGLVTQGRLTQEPYGQYDFLEVEIIFRSQGGKR